MTRVKKNVLANTLSSLWIPLLGLAFAPIYMDLMGAEGFALVGLFVTIQALSAPLDAGLRTTLGRELARLNVLPDTAQEMRDLSRTLEIIYLIMAVLLGILIVAVSPLISRYWVRPIVLSHQEVLWSLILMGVALACQWPMHLYDGGLMGLEHQVLLSGLNVAMYTLRYAGVLPILLWVRPSPAVFFAFQAVLALIQTWLTRWFLWRSLPAATRREQFRVESFRKIWRFTAGMTGIIITGALISQMDRILLSNGRLLSLEMFGYYSLAAIAASVLSRIVQPVRMALSPRFAALVSLSDEEELTRLYHRGCQVVSVLLLTPAILGAVFSREILLVWTADPVKTENTCLVLRLLLLAWAVNGLMTMAMGLQLAYGWTRLAFHVSLAGCLVLPVLMTVLAMRYQAAGAVVALGAVFAVQAAATILLMHRRILRGQAGRWALRDVGLPLAAVAAVATLAWWARPQDLSRIGMLSWLAVSGLAGLAASALVCDEVRGSLNHILMRFRKRLHPGS
jgi:O-antigen/teichoic acid export membrane protein